MARFLFTSVPVEGHAASPLAIMSRLVGDGHDVTWLAGATDPSKADANTIRKVHALSIGENSVHGSDAPETAVEEIAYWFSGTEIVG